MSKFLSLFKVDFMNNFGLGGLRSGLKDKKQRRRILLIALAFTGFIPIYYVLIKQLYLIYDIFTSLNQLGAFLNLGIIASQGMVLILGLPYVISKLYFSNDIEYLIPLPIKTSYILGTKFLGLLIQEYLVILPVVLPFFIIHILKTGFNIFFIIKAIIILLTIPIIPLGILTILTMVFMRFINLTLNKDLFLIIWSLLLVIFIIGGQFLMQDLMEMDMVDNTDDFMKLFENSTFLLESISKIYPLSLWATLFLIGSSLNTSLANGVLYLGISILILLIMFLVGDKIFIKGLIMGKEVSTKKKRFKKTTVKDFKKNKKYIAIAKKELKMIIKTPVYLINTLVAMLLVPIIMGFSMYKSMNGKLSVPSMNEILNITRMMYSENRWEIILLIIGGFLFFTILNTTTSTSFSREGKAFWIQRVLPISGKDQVIGRSISGLILQLFGSLLVVIVGIFLFKMNLVEILIVLVMGILGSLPIIILGLLVDVSRPMLKWDNPQKAMKENLNSLISMGINLAYLGVLGFIGFKTIMKIDIIYVYALYLFIFLICIWMSYTLTVNRVNKQIMEIE